MLTDEETRDLLHGAAETIDVPPGAAVPPPRRAWPALVAVAAAVAVVTVGVGVAVRPDGTTPPPPGEATSSATADPTADPYAGDPAFHLGPDQVPSVEGLSGDAAVRKLTAAGFRVEVRDEPSCWAGRALGTEPGLGALVEPGATVTVLRGDSSGSNCLNAPDFGLLDFLAGNGAAPPFAEEVSIYQDDDDARVIRGQQAADVASWPRRDVVMRLLDTVVYDSGEFHPVAINVGNDPDDFSCGRAEPLGVTGGGEAFILAPWHLGGAVPLNGACVDLGIYENPAGAITAVQIDARSDKLAGPPSVLGNSQEFARTRIGAAGYHAEFVAITDCAPVGIVSRQQPAVDFAPGDTLIFGLTTRTGACAPDDWASTTPPTASADSVADSFLRFAAGGPSPAWANDVTLYIADATMGTLSAPGDRREWGFCLTPDAIPTGRSCLSGNVLDIVADQQVTVEEGFADDRCLFHASQSLSDFKIPTATLRGPGECGVAVELWTNDEGRISGVNYLYSRDALLPSSCTAADAVQIADDGGEGAGATTWHYWHLTADRPCTLRGYPTVTLYDDSGTVLDLPSLRSRRDVETVLVGDDLGPAVVLGVSRCDITPDAGSTASARIELPGDAGVLNADTEFAYCPDEAQHLLIDPVTTWQ